LNNPAQHFHPLDGGRNRKIFDKSKEQTGRNELNTFNQTYTRDMVIDPPLTVEFKLTDSELAAISRKIDELRLFDIAGLNNRDKNIVQNTMFKLLP